MNFRISWDYLKSDPLHPVWLVGYSVIGLIVFAQIASWYFTPNEWKGFLITPTPYIVAGGHLIAEGLERFSGNAVRREWDSAQTGLVLSFVLCYILAVSGFCWGLRERSQWRRLPEGRGFPFRVAFALGSSIPIVVIGISLLAMTGAYISNSVWASMKEAQRSGVNRDYTINNLSIMALNAQSFSRVPITEGGGGGKWMNIKGGALSSLTLERIAVKDPGIKRVLESLFPQETPTFRLEIFDEDSIGIWGIGNEQGDLPLFVNKDGREGMVQAYAIVTPQNVVIRTHN